MSFPTGSASLPAMGTSETNDEPTVTMTQEQLQAYVDAQIQQRQANSDRPDEHSTASAPQWSNQIGNETAIGRNVAHVAFKPPQPLYGQNPSVWFNILEQSFQLANVRIEQTKYAHALAALDARHHDTFADLILRDKGPLPYSAFKEEVLRILGESEKTKLNNLLHGLTLGDQKPSQLLNKMKMNAGRTFDENTLRQLWMKRLPPQIQMILTTFEKDIPLASLSNRADSILETMTQSHINVLTNTTASTTGGSSNNAVKERDDTDNRLDKLTRVIAELCTSIKDSRSRNESRGTSHERKATRSASRQTINKRYDQCYYHYKFGAKARKCVSGCKYHSEQTPEKPKNF